MKDYFNSLIAKDKPVHAARHMVARKIADLALSIMASEKLYQSGRFKQCKAGSGN